MSSRIDLHSKESDFTVLYDHKKRTPLHIAASQGYVDILSDLLSEGIDCNLADSQSCSPLLLAAQKSEACFKLLLEKGAKVNQLDHRGAGIWHYAALNPNSKPILSLLYQLKNTHDQIDLKKPSALCYAAKANNLDAIDYLAYYGSSLKNNGGSSSSPLHIAAEKNYASLACRLIGHGVDVDLLDKNGQSPLSIASQKGNLDVCRTLIINSANVNSQDQDLETPLYKAAIYGHIEIACRLINAGANVNVLSKSNQSIRYQAVKQRHFEIANMLKQKGGLVIAGKEELLLHRALASFDDQLFCQAVKEKTSINAFDADKQTPLMLALMTSQEDCVHNLLKKGADVNLKDSHQLTALHYAALYASKNTISKIIQKGAMIIENHEGQTPLHYAAVSGNSGAIDLIGKHINQMQMNINSLDQGGNSALHLAVLHHQFKSLLQLIKIGANPLIVDYGGKNAFHHAASTGNLKALKLLVSVFKAGINIKDNEGRTALYYAEQNGFEEIVNYLIRQKAVVQEDESHLVDQSTSNMNLDHIKTALQLQVPKIKEENKISFSGSINTNLKAGKALLNARDNEKRTILHIAAQNNDLLSLKNALIAKVDPDAIDIYGKTALHYVVEQENTDAITLLAIYGANLIASDPAGQTPLNFALKQSNDVLDHLKELMGLSKKIRQLPFSLLYNPHSHKKRIALLELVRCGNKKKVVDFLLQGANIFISDHRKMGALHYAVMQNDPEMINILYQQGADMNQLNNEGQSALHIATAVNNQQAVKTLLKIIKSKKDE